MMHELQVALGCTFKFCRHMPLAVLLSRADCSGLQNENHLVQMGIENACCCRRRYRGSLANSLATSRKPAYAHAWPGARLHIMSFNPMVLETQAVLSRATHPCLRFLFQQQHACLQTTEL